ncbi:hypothetical protein WKS98_03395 [Lagierella sp. ICN-221743]
MIEITIKKYLEKNLKVPIFLEVPEKMPSKFIVFEKTGSSRKNYLNSSTFAFQSYALNLYGAAKLNEELKEVVLKMLELPEMANIKLNSDYNFTDMDLKKYRYQAVFDIYHY